MRSRFGNLFRRAIGIVQRRQVIISSNRDIDVMTSRKGHQDIASFVTQPRLSSVQLVECLGRKQPDVCLRKMIRDTRKKDRRPILINKLVECRSNPEADISMGHTTQRNLALNIINEVRAEGRDTMARPGIPNQNSLLLVLVLDFMWMAMRIFKCISPDSGGTAHFPASATQTSRHAS
mmetsp:Transcript_26767/g.61121  ORF Transcript_26767/g.61121 Transcript_26767/m.61121 type:complete len:178 (+) Transcript_26767:966-1499(+)